jgi:hypothetical protein
MPGGHFPGDIRHRRSRAHAQAPSTRVSPRTRPQLHRDHGSPGAARDVHLLRPVPARRAVLGKGGQVRQSAVPLARLGDIADQYLQDTHAVRVSPMARVRSAEVDGDTVIDLSRSVWIGLCSRPSRVVATFKAWASRRERRAPPCRCPPSLLQVECVVAVRPGVEGPP